MDKQYLLVVYHAVFIPLTAAMISTDTHIFGPRQNHQFVHSGDDCLKSVQRVGPVQPMSNIHTSYIRVFGGMETYGTMSALGSLHVF